MNKQFTSKELFFLAEYINQPTIFGLTYEESGIEERAGLIEKGILGKKGELTERAVAYVEALRKYNQSFQYVHVAQLIFGVQQDGLCILLQQIGMKEETRYEIVFCEVVEMFRILLQHPLMKKSAASVYQELFPEEELPKTLKIRATQRGQLLIELFNQEQERSNYLLIGYKRGTYYSLDEETYEYKDEIEEINTLQWLLTHFDLDMKPFIHTILTLLQKEEKR